jgi:hypothetical protein
MAWWFVWNGDLNLHFGSSNVFMAIKGRKEKRRKCWQETSASS